MKWFTAQNLDDLKKEYYKLAKKHHPDVGGSEEDMKEIIAEYEMLFNKMHASGGSAEYTADSSNNYEVPHNLVDAINRLIHIQGIELEICGRWIWITGDTYSVRDKLKDAGCRWAPKKKMWYWRPDDFSGSYHKPLDMERIRFLHGSHTMNSDRASGLCKA